MNFPNISERGCTDSGITCQSATLILKPGAVMMCDGSQVQFRAFVRTEFGEIPVFNNLVFSSDNLALATVDANTGLATLGGEGAATISVSWQNLRAWSKVTITAASETCSDVKVAYAIVMDNSASMSEAFNDYHGSKLDAAKTIADGLIDGMDTTKDVEGLMSFATAPHDVVVLGDKILESSDVESVSQTQSQTIFSDALEQSIFDVGGQGADQQVIILITDGESCPVLSDSEQKKVLASAAVFKGKGGVIIVVGLRAWGEGFDFLQQLATPGFFKNVFGEGDLTDNNVISDLQNLLVYFCGSTVNYLYLYAEPDMPISAQTPDPKPNFHRIEFPEVWPEYTSVKTFLGDGSNVPTTATAASDVSQADADTRAMAIAARLYNNAYVPTSGQVEGGAGQAGGVTDGVGLGSPEGVVTAPPGTPYLDLNTNNLWIKRSGTGNTGWVQITG